MPTPWDHVRAVLICAHIAVITLAAVPTPSGDLTPQRKQDPEVREALDPWTGLVIQLGFASDDDGAVDWLFDRGNDLVSTRKRALGSSVQYLRFTGNGQSWRMFGVAPAKHARLQVLGGFHDGTLEPLYDEHQGPNWDWMVLDHSRVRSLRSSFGSKEMRGRYNTFARWLARRALDEHPQYDFVRVQYQGVVIPPPEKLRAQGGLTLTKVYWPIDIKRDEAK